MARPFEGQVGWVTSVLGSFTGGINRIWRGTMKKAFVLGVAVCAWVTFNVSAATHYVSLDSPNPSPPYTNWDTAAHVIQDAVDAAKAGDTVLVTNGVYAVGEREVSELGLSRVVITQSISLRSVNGPLLTTIEGSTLLDERGQATNGIRCMFLGTKAMLGGFTLTKGFRRFRTTTYDAESGGGVYCDSTDALLTNCVLTGNSAGYSGGGVRGGTLRNCLLTNNSAYWGGGAESSTLFDCVLVGNSQTNALNWVGDCSLGGGAAWCTLYNCVLNRNTGECGVAGGAAWSTLYDCTLTQNSAQEAGGAFECTLYNSTLTGNWAEFLGGAVYYGTLHNCTLIGNSAEEGGGAYSSTLYNCTLTFNSATRGGGAFGGTLHNCITYYNSAANGANYFAGKDPRAEGREVTTELHYSCTTPLPTNGAGNITGPPLFMYMAAGDFRLREGSPCIDAGTNLVGFSATVTNIGCDPSVSAYTHEPTDILGNTRFIDGNGDGKVAWDIGAYEFNSFKPPRFTSVPQFTLDGWKLNVTGAPNKWTRVQKSNNSKDWEDIWSGFMGEGVRQVTDSDVGQKVMFYRAVVP